VPGPAREGELVQTTMNRLIRLARILTGLVLACVCIFQFLLEGAACAASSTKLAWDASQDTNIAGYNIYRSNQSGSYTSAALNGASPISTVSFTDFTALSGTYYYVVKAVDSAGRESPASNEVQAVVRTSPINTAPVANAGSDRMIRLPATATLVGTAADDGLPNGTLTYSWSVAIGTGVSVASPNSSSTQVSFSAAGKYTLRLTVSDGQLSSTDDVVVTVSAQLDTTPPTVFITSPLDSAVIASNPHVTLSAAASDDVGVVGVQFKLNGTNWGAEDTTAPYSVSWNSKKVDPGIYTIQAVARDAAGNRSTSTPVSVTITKRGNISEPVREGRVYVNVNGPVNTALSVTNDESEATVVSFYFTDAAGIDFGHGTFTLEAKQSRSSFLNEAPFNLATLMEGTLTFYSSLPIAVAALRSLTNEGGELLMTRLPVTSPVTPTAAASILLPHFADGAGWSTQIVLVNPTDTPLAGTLRFFGSSSSTESAGPLTVTLNGVTDSSFDYTLPRRTSVRFSTANLSPHVQSGYVLATARDNHATPQGLSILSLSDQGVTISETGVSAGSSGTSFRTYVAKSGMLHSGLAVANPSASSILTTLELFTIDGSPTHMTTSVEIPARGHIARFIDDLFPTMPEGFQGTLRILATQPVGVTYLRFQHNDHGEVVFTGVPVLDEASPERGFKRSRVD